MDLVRFDRGVFEAISSEFSSFLDDADIHAIPISALEGDNVIAPSRRTPWFDGPALLPHLETLQVDRDLTGQPLRYPVQLVLRAGQDFRGYAGQIASGAVRPGDRVTVWPSGLATTVKRIVTWDGDLDVAFSPMSVTLVLADDIDISRGDVIASGPVAVGKRFSAQVVWMDERPLDPRRVYALKHTSRTVTAEIDRPLELNQIGAVTVSTSRAVVFDRYTDSRAMGSFILIDPATNFTAGAGMIVEAVCEPEAALPNAMLAHRLAAAARAARSESDAVEAVRNVLEEILT
jgi:sulfate adenylyltransferase subunit 1 (EFTu-like GTPase family)